MEPPTMSLAPTPTQTRMVMELVRLVARGFYPEENGIYIVILDALTRQKNYIRDEDLAAVLKLHPQQVRKALAQLEKDKLIKKENRKEQKEKLHPNDRNASVTHTYIYIDYKHFIDVVRYRIHLLHQEIEKELEQDTSVGYKCNKCGRQYSLLDTPSLLSPSGELQCIGCGTEITQLSNEASADRPTNPLVEQIRPIADLLKKVKDIPLPVVNPNPATLQSLGLTTGSTTTTTTTTKSANIGPVAPKIIVQLDAAPVNTSMPQLNGMGLGAGGGRPLEEPKKELPKWYQSKEVEAAKAKARQEEEESTHGDGARDGNNTSAPAPSQTDPETYKAYITEYLKAYSYQLQQQQKLQQQVPAQAATPTATQPISIKQENGNAPVVLKSIKQEETARPVDAATSIKAEPVDDTASDEQTFLVAGQPKRLSEITQEDKDKMTPEEYTAYYEATASDVYF